MTAEPVILDRSDIDRLIEILADRGYRVIGPTVRAGAIVLGDIDSTSALPVGVGAEQAPGRYRLTTRPDDALFGHAVGPTAAKAFLHPSGATLWVGERTSDGSFVTVPPDEQPRFAFVGLRPCDAAAIAIHDGVFLRDHRDRVYGDRREGAFIVVANCSEPGATCFCASVGTGPAVSAPHDIAITEVPGDGEHWYLAEPGSEAGVEMLAVIDGRPAATDQIDLVRERLGEAARNMGRSLDVDGIAERIRAALDSPRWEEIATRCLTCGNCTLVCPTCFCAIVEDHADLTGDRASRVRRWDSCLNQEFSYIHGGPLRPSPHARYRQWLTHKLSAWVDQFGELGCVGCGRCITWCPVGIDITVEAVAVAAEMEETRV